MGGSRYSRTEDFYGSLWRLSWELWRIKFKPFEVLVGGSSGSSKRHLFIIHISNTKLIQKKLNFETLTITNSF